VVGGVRVRVLGGFEIEGLEQSAEAWRLTALVAAVGKVDRWWALAETRVAELAAGAGPHADSLQRVAGTTLDMMRTPSRRR
jgi:hypothetical protein